MNGKKLIEKKIDWNHFSVDNKTGNALLKLDGELVVIYNKYHNKDFDTHNKFHLCNCDKVEKMKKDKDDRIFAVASQESVGTLESAEKGKIELLPCGRCLLKLNYIFHPGVELEVKKEIASNFDIEEFFNFFGNPNPDGYHPNWENITDYFRAKKHWTCEGKECGVVLEENGYYKLLDTHHIDGNKFNNKISNFKALCKICHEEVHGYSYGFYCSQEDRQTIKDLLVEQKKQKNLQNPN